MRALSSEPVLWSTVDPIKSYETIPVSSGWILFVVFWLVSCLGGLALATMAGQPVLGILVAGIPTLIGVVVNPTFALCCIALMLPIGEAIAVRGVLSGDRVIGGVAALGILAHSLISGQGIRLKGSPLIPLFLLAAWGTASCLWAAYPLPAVTRALQLIQLAIWGLAIWNALAYRGNHVWPMRCLVLGTIGAVCQLYMSGSLQRTMHAGERVAIGEDINPGNFAILLGGAFFLSVYLIARDPIKVLRPLWVLGALLSPAVMIETGSRGPVLAFAAAIAVSMLSFRSLRKSKGMLIGTVLIIILAAGGTLWSMRGGFDSDKSVTRLTNTKDRVHAFSYRMLLVSRGVRYILRRPLTGAGIGNYILTAGERNHVHVDIIHLGTELGIPAMILYAWFLLKLVTAFMRTQSVWEKWLMRTIFVFLAIGALGHVLYPIKTFWYFSISAAAICYRVREAEQAQLANPPTYNPMFAAHGSSADDRG